MAVRNDSERVRKRVIPKQITYLLAAHTQAMLLCLTVARENELYFVVVSRFLVGPCIYPQIC